MKIIFSEKAPKPIGPYSHAVKANGFLFVSGQLGIDSEGNVKRNIEDQTEQCILNIKSILEKEGLTLKNVVKATVYLKSMDDFQKMNAIYEKYFIGKPARACIGVGLIKDFKVEIEAIASYD